MLGQTTPYLSKLKNTIDVGAATGMYASHFAEHSKSVICFEAVPPVYEQLILIKEKYNNVVTHNLAVSDFEGKSAFYVDDKRLSNEIGDKESAWIWHFCPVRGDAPSLLSSFIFFGMLDGFPV